MYSIKTNLIKIANFRNIVNVHNWTDPDSKQTDPHQNYYKSKNQQCLFLFATKKSLKLNFSAN